MDDLTALERLYAEVRGVRRDLRAGDRLRDDLGLDSLALAELVTSLEDELGLALASDERVASVETVGELLDILRSVRGE